MSQTADEVRERRASDPEFAERTRVATRKYRAANLEKERERDRESKAKKRIADREAHNAYMREWNLKNRDRINAKNRERLATDVEYAEKIRLQDRERHKLNPDRARKQNLKSMYGITLEQYEALYKSQDGKCLICNGSFPNRGKDGLVVDHCHNEGHIRGLLCAKCNTGLGQFGDDIQRLQNAIEYLKG